MMASGTKPGDDVNKGDVIGAQVEPGIERRGDAAETGTGTEIEFRDWVRTNVPLVDHGQCILEPMEELVVARLLVISRVIDQMVYLRFKKSSALTISLDKRGIDNEIFHHYGKRGICGYYSSRSSIPFPGYNEGLRITRVIFSEPHEEACYKLLPTPLQSALILRASYSDDLQYDISVDPDDNRVTLNFAWKNISRAFFFRSLSALIERYTMRLGSSSLVFLNPHSAKSILFGKIHLYGIFCAPNSLTILKIWKVRVFTLMTFYLISEHCGTGSMEIWFIRHMSPLVP
ncbi:hypothetical protein Pelo_730 [Pelomyxa schiedti]|nr:hypothetical protein Pelo_730 [Pelomyxa schiedti]